MAFPTTPPHEWGGGSSTSTNPQTFTIPGGQGASVGSLVALGAVATNARTLTSVTDSKGNTWTVHPSQSAGGTNVNVAIAYAVLTTALVAGDTITLTFSGNASVAVTAVEITGQAASSIVDQSGTYSAAGTSSSFAHPISSAGATDTSGEYVFVAWGYNGSNNGTPGAGYTAQTRQASTGTVRSITGTYAANVSTGTQSTTLTVNVSTSGHIAAVMVTFRPASGLTAVGKSLQLVWDTRAPVADTLQLAWHTRAAVSDELQLLWHTRAAVADTLALAWDVRQAVGPSLQLIWHTRAAVAATLQLLWHTRALVSDDLGLAWAVRQVVADTLALLWDTRAAIGDDLALSWHTRALAADELQLLWAVRTMAGADLQLAWDTRAAVGDDLGLLWGTRGLAGAELSLLWDVEEIFVPGVVGVELGLLWSVRALAGADLALTWDVRQAVGDTLQLLWAVRQPVGADLSLLWHARAISGQSLQLAWAVRQAVADELALTWAVRGLAGADLHLLWDTDSHLVELPPTTRVAVRWLGQQGGRISPGRVGLTPGYRLRWDAPGSVRSDEE